MSQPMTAIEKAKDLFWCEECDSMVTENHRCEQWSNVTRIPAKAVKALAALEAEKPAEDADFIRKAVIEIGMNFKKSYMFAAELSLIKFAKSYHAKRCAECKRHE